MINRAQITRRSAEDDVPARTVADGTAMRLKGRLIVTLEG